jgi:hypothetical protein
MLNKELLMAVDKDLELVLSIYWAPGNHADAKVDIMLSSGIRVEVPELTGKEIRFKFSYIDVTAAINIEYNQYLAHITTKNLVDSPIQTIAPEITHRSLWIEDVTQSASLVIE